MPGRYATIIEDGVIYVEADVGRVEVGPLACVIDHYGQTYEITYDESVKDRYDISFADEGMKLDVRETVEMMTHPKSEVESIKGRELSADSSKGFSSERMAYFCGMLHAVLNHGLA